MNKIVIDERHGYLTKDETTSKGIFIYYCESDPSHQGKPWKYVSMIEVFARKSGLDAKRWFYKRRKITKFDVDHRMTVTSHINMRPEMLPGIIQNLQRIYKEVTGVSDLEAKVAIDSAKEEDEVGKLMQKVGGLS